jgi:RNA:NAD 2'-phosphotransferase (TPT1/KptA family)
VKSIEYGGISMDDSVFTSYIVETLREEPERLSLDMNEVGWVSWDDLTEGVDAYMEVDYELKDIRSILDEYNRGRLDIEDGRLRASGKHTADCIEYPIEEPPEELYYAVSSSKLEAVHREGVPHKDGYYKVFEEPEKALDERPGLQTPRLIRIRAEPAWFSGILFHRFKEDWYMQDMKPAFIKPYGEDAQNTL